MHRDDVCGSSNPRGSRVARTTRYTCGRVHGKQPGMARARNDIQPHVAFSVVQFQPARARDPPT